MTACLLYNEPTSYSCCARLSPYRGGAAAKASLNRAIEYSGVDAKPSDLSMARVKWR